MKRLDQCHSFLLKFFSDRSQNTRDAEVLAQEVLDRIVKCDDTPASEYPEAYLYAIAQNVLRDQTLDVDVSQNDQGPIPCDVQSGGIPPLGDSLHAGKDKQYQCFLAALSTLTAKTRDIFLLNRYEGLTYIQIAELRDISVTTVEKHMMKALAQIRKTLNMP